MALVLNEEQRMLRDSTRDFLRDNANVEQFRQLRDSEDDWDSATWANMAELGISAIPIPENYGGLEFGYLALGAVFEECGRQLTASPLLSTVVLGASLIELAGSEAQKNELLAAVASGETNLAVALEEDAHHQPSNIGLKAERSADGYRLTGKKQFVIDGLAANHIIVAARTAGDAGDEHGISLFLVAGDAAGLSRHSTSLLDSREYAELHFADVELSSDALLGEEGKGYVALTTALDRGRACLAAEMLGGAQELLERTVAYLQEREQFGAKIGSFQALQHRAAMLYSELELTRSSVVDALSAIDEGREDVAAAVSTAKCRANDTFKKMANEAVQLHGGIGVTDELDIGLFLKRCRVSMQLLGSSSFHTDRFATLNNF